MCKIYVQVQEGPFSMPGQDISNAFTLSCGSHCLGQNIVEIYGFVVPIDAIVHLQGFW